MLANFNKILLKKTFLFHKQEAETPKVLTHENKTRIIIYVSTYLSSKQYFPHTHCILSPCSSSKSIFQG